MGPGVPGLVTEWASCQYPLRSSLYLGGHTEIQTLGCQIPKSLQHSIAAVTPAAAGGPKEAPSPLQLELSLGHLLQPPLCYRIQKSGPGPT